MRRIGVDPSTLAGRSEVSGGFGDTCGAISGCSGFRDRHAASRVRQGRTDGSMIENSSEASPKLTRWRLRGSSVWARGIFFRGQFTLGEDVLPARGVTRPGAH